MFQLGLDNFYDNVHISKNQFISTMQDSVEDLEQAYRTKIQQLDEENQRLRVEIEQLRQASEYSTSPPLSSLQSAICLD